MYVGVPTLVCCCCYHPEAQSHVLDVAYDEVGALAIGIGVLTPADRADMGRNTRVNNVVFFARVAVCVQPTNDKEAVADMELPGEAGQLTVQIGGRRLW